MTTESECKTTVALSGYDAFSYFQRLLATEIDIQPL